MRQRKKYAISNIKVKSQCYNKNVNNPIWGLKGIFDLENTALGQECMKNEVVCKSKFFFLDN